MRVGVLARECCRMLVLQVVNAGMVGVGMQGFVYGEVERMLGGEDRDRDIGVAVLFAVVCQLKNSQNSHQHTRIQNILMLSLEQHPATRTHP